MQFCKPTLRSKLSAFIILVVLFSSCSVRTPQKSDLESKSKWIETTLKRFTLEKKIGQMIMSKAYGYYYSSQSDEYHRLEHLVKEHKFGSLIFMQGDVYETAQMINRMQELSDVPLLIGSDFEWGPAMRIRRSTRFPEAMALGAARDTVLAYQMGKAIGQESRAIGVHQNFGPVADVNSNPDNPVINTRSFGENPELVADLANAVMLGLTSEGVIATAKHFPGHGDTQTDSHLNLPVISVSRGRLDSVELLPYKKIISAGIPSIMIAHLEVPAIQQNEIEPATLSKLIVTDLLKNELGFRGLVVTDAMEMGALVNAYGSDSAAVRAIEAGVDLMMILPDEDGAVEAIANAVTIGRIPESRIDQSVRKILGLKWDLGLVENRFVDLNNVRNVVATPEHLQLAKRIARNSITVLKNDSLLPFVRFGSKKILNVIVSDAEQYRTEIQRTSSPWPNEPVGDYFTVQLRKRYSNVESVRLDPSSNKMDIDSILKKVKTSDIILCPLFTKARSGSGKFGLQQSLIDAVDSMLVLKKPTVFIAMGSPYVLSSFPQAGAYMCSYSDCEASTEAVIEALFGEIPTKGKLPVTIPNMFAYGDGIDLLQTVLRKDIPANAGFSDEGFSKIDSVMRKAISDSAFPGAQLCVVKDGALVYNKSFGMLEYSSNSPRVNSSTMYDIASLTKVVVTTSCIMKLYDEGKLRLEDTVAHFIPEFVNHGKENITIRNLLMHSAGLPPFKLFYLTCKTPEEVLDSIYHTNLIYPPGDSTVYSDFGFIILGKIVEAVSGVSLDVYARKSLFVPLEMEQTMYSPPSSYIKNIAPTEVDTVWRKKLIWGTVHDETAALLGGVAGHAGLFSTASDLAVFMQMMMSRGSYGGRQLLKPETVELFTTLADTKSRRALGWDTKTMNGYSTAGSLFGPKSFGHTGFTGTSLWADPEKKIFVILLTNRVNPTRNNTKIQQIRPAVHDAVVRALK